MATEIVECSLRNFVKSGDIEQVDVIRRINQYDIRFTVEHDIILRQIYTQRIQTRPVYVIRIGLPKANHYNLLVLPVRSPSKINLRTLQQKLIFVLLTPESRERMIKELALPLG
jgi:hypothetical protein